MNNAIVTQGLPFGLDRAIMDALPVGRDKAAGRMALVRVVRGRGFDVSERQVRLAISRLRKSGALICSAAGNDGGYYLPANKAEYEDFVHQEYLAKIDDMRETLGAMQAAAKRRWPDSLQGRLF